jgi:hypothetical protein
MSKVILNDVRLAFPQLFEAAQVNGEGKPAFSASLLFPKTHPAYAAVQKAILETAKEKWPKEGEKIAKLAFEKDKTCLHNGNDKEKYDGFPGNWYVSCRTQTRPLVLAADKSPLTEKDGKPYAGCYVNASIEIWAQDNQFGKRINAQLKGVQFLRDGDAFSAAAPGSPDDFEDLSDGAQAETTAADGGDDLLG